MKDNNRWDEKDVPSLEGKIFVVTGTTSGIGTAMTRILVSKGARVITGNRNNERAQTAVNEAAQAHGGQNMSGFSSETLDLSSNASVRAFAEKVNDQVDHIDGLICNAGIMAVDHRVETEDGVESQMAVNVVGHHLLTSLLLPKLLATEGCAVVLSTSSAVAEQAKVSDFDDINCETRKYSPFGQYAVSKVGALVWKEALRREIAKAGHSDKLHVVSMHPGGTVSPLQDKNTNTWLGTFLRWGRIMYMKPDQGCLGSVRGVVDPSVPDGAYLGPRGLLGRHRHHPIVIPHMNKPVTDNADVQAKLWAFCQEKTGASWSF